jgi:hypothetical protein
LELGNAAYLFVKLYECGFKLFSDVSTEMVLEDGLTEALALLRLATLGGCALRAVGHGIEGHGHVLTVSNLF